jgi:hypothetical protein
MPTGCILPNPYEAPLVEDRGQVSNCEVNSRTERQPDSQDTLGQSNGDGYRAGRGQSAGAPGRFSYRGLRREYR